VENVEIDEAEFFTADFQIGEQLGGVDRVQFFDGFDFDNDLVFDHQIQPISGFDQNIVVSDWKIDFPLDLKATSCNSNCKQA
jgi:hypothetical protein